MINFSDKCRVLRDMCGSPRYSGGTKLDKNGPFSLFGKSVPHPRVETSNWIANLFRNHQRLSSDQLIPASVNVAGDVVVTRIEWITRARNDAALSRSPSSVASTGSRTPGLNPISLPVNPADESRTRWLATRG